MASNQDSVSNILAIATAVVTDSQGSAPRNAGRSRKEKLTESQMTERKTMLVALQKFECIWRVLPGDGKRGRPTSSHRDEWQAIAKTATGSSDNGDQVKKWYTAIKRGMDYRIKKAHMEQIVSAEKLYEKGISELFEAHPYEYWVAGEFLAKLLVFKIYRVDIDGVFTPSSQNQSNASRNNVSYSVLLRGVPGVEPPAFHDIPRMERRRSIVDEIASRQVSQGGHGDAGVFGDETLHIEEGEASVNMPTLKQESENDDYADATPSEPLQQQGTAVEAVNTQSLGELKQIKEEPLTPPNLDQVKNEPMDPLDEDQNENAMDAEETWINEQNLNLQELDQPSSEQTYATHFPTTATILPTPHFNITQDEMNGRSGGLEKFKKLVNEKILRLPIEEKFAFMVSFIKASPQVAPLVEQGKSESEITDGFMRALNLN